MAEISSLNFSQINWKVILGVVLLFSIGLLNLYSASGIRTEEGVLLNPYFQKQLVWGVFGCVLMLGTIAIDYRHLHIFSISIFVVTLLLLLLIPIFGKVVYGARRWISLGFINVQPSEFAKVAILLISARFLSKRKELLSWKELFLLTVIIAPPCFLVLKQPDLGTTLCMLAIAAGIVVYRGIQWRVVRVLLVVLPLLIPCMWFFLHDYQKDRILTFLDPTRDQLGSGYHVIQSQIAIGSGGILGNGYLRGSQSQLRFLPEKHTDFALAVFGEEWGFLGLMILVVAYILFLYGLYEVARDAKDRFGSYIVVGVFFYFYMQIFVNMGMVSGIMPVVGIPLPFISYGGTSALVNFAFVGLVLNVSMRRFVFKE